MPEVIKTLNSLLPLVTGVAILSSCGGTPKPAVPALTPENAAAMLRNYPKAQTWITYVKRQNPACDYRLDLPDQASHPSTIDLDHIVVCGASPSPKEFDASVSFEYDKDAQHWVVSKFAS